jgi:hypothetical protein
MFGNSADEQKVVEEHWKRKLSNYPSLANSRDICCTCCKILGVIKGAVGVITDKIRLPTFNPSPCSGLGFAKAPCALFVPDRMITCRSYLVIEAVLATLH